MQKKIIASLLMTPVAFSALADINVTENSGISNDKWISESVTGDDLVSGGVVTGGIGIGSITQTIKVPCAGKYNLSFESPENLKITVAGSGITQEGTGVNSATFTAAGAADVTITIEASDPAAKFSFAAPTLKIVYDFAAANAAMTAALGDALTITPVVDVPDGNARKSIADGLTKRGEALQQNRGAIVELIGKIVETGDAAKDLKTYTDYKLYDEVNTIQAQIDDLQAKADVLNTEIANFNTLFNLETTSLPELKGLVKAQLDLISAAAVKASDEAKDLSGEDKDGAAAYVSSTCSAQGNATNADVEAYAAAINAAYSSLSEEFKPAKDYAALKKEISELTGTVAKAYQEVASYAALNGLENGMRAQLNEAVYNAQNTIIEIKSEYKELPYVYSTKKTEWLTDIETANAAAVQVFDATKWGNATENLSKNQAALSTATGAIDAVVTAANQLSGEQNGAMKAALKIYNDNKKVYDELVDIARQLTLSDANNAEYNKVKKAAEEALAAFLNVITTEYGKLDLQEADYTTEKEDLDDAMEALKTFKGKIQAQFNAQKELEVLKKYLQDNQGALAGDGVSATFLEDMFAKNIESLQAAVNAVTADSEENVIAAINDYKNFAGEVVAALKVAKTATEGFSKSISWLKGLNTQQFFDKTAYAGFGTLQTEITAYEKKDAEWKAEYTRVTGTTDPQECYEAVKELGDDITTYGWSAKITSSFNAYIDGLTQGQYDVADAALQQVIAAIPTLAGDEEKPYDEAVAELAKIQPEVAAAIANAEGNEKKLAACNAVIEKLQTLWTNSIMGMKANVDDYNALIKSINTQLGTPLAQLNALIGSPCGDAALTAEQRAAVKKHYQDMADAAKTTLEKYPTELAGLLKKLEVTANKSKYEGLISAQAAKLGETGTIATSIKNNEAKFKEELASEKGTKQLIINLLAEIEKEGNAQEYGTEWTNQLNKLLTEDIVAVNKTRNNAYMAGDCEAQNSEILAGYDAISAAANDVLKSFSEGWNTLVYNHNMELLNSTAWDVAKDNMESTYVNAINAFNSYSDLPNYGYTHFQDFLDVTKNNAYLFDLSTDSRALIKEVETYVATKTAQGYAISELEFKTVALDEADNIIADMVSKVDNMIKEFNAAGEAYYTILTGEFDTTKQERETLLAGYGYTAAQITTFLKKYVDLAADAKKAKDACPAGTLDTYEKSVGYQMGYIADTLDAAIDINLNEQVIKHEWNPTYEQAVKDFAELEKKYKAYANIEGFEETYNSYLATFNSYKSAAESLNETIADIDNLLAEVYPGMTWIKYELDNLQYYLDMADYYLEQLDGAKKDFERETGYETSLATAKAASTALEKIVTLGGPAGQNVSCIDAVEKVKTFATILGRYKTPSLINGVWVYATQTDVENARDAANTAINAVLDLAYGAEKTWLGSTSSPKTLLQELVIAYNNAYAKADGEPREGITAEVEAARDGVNALPTNAAAAAALKLTPEQYYEKAAALEASISNLTVELQNYVEGTSKALNDAQTKFASAYNNAKSTVESYQWTLNSGYYDYYNGVYYAKRVKEEYNPEYEALLSNIAAIQEAFNAAGNDVIAQWPEYVKQLNAETAKLSGIQSDINNAQANSMVYDDLTDKLAEGIQADFDALKAKAENYGVYAEFSGSFVEIDLVIKDIEKDLADRYAERTLTADPTLKATLVAKANALISALNTQVEAAYAPALRNSTKEELDKVLTWLNELKDSDYKILPSATENGTSISDEYKALLDRWTVNNTALREYDPTAPDADANITKIINEYNAITAAAQALLQTAMNSSYKLGDLNNDGTVTIADAQVMRELIINRVTFEDLLVSDRREAYAANIIGNDQIDIADYTALVNIILTQVDNGDGPNRVKAINESPLGYFSVANSIEASGSINVVPVAEENGIRTYAIEINNPEQFVAGQIDLRVESTSHIVEVRGAERLSNHEVMYNSDTETTRVLITSLNNDMFEGNGGVTLYVDVDGRSGLGFENAIFTDENAQAFTFVDKRPDTTGIDSLYEGAKAVKETIYDVTGRVVNGIRRGINIIRNSDGTVTKEMHK